MRVLSKNALKLIIIQGVLFQTIDSKSEDSPTHCGDLYIVKSSCTSKWNDGGGYQEIICGAGTLGLHRYQSQTMSFMSFSYTMGTVSQEEAKYAGYSITTDLFFPLDTSSRSKESRHGLK